MNTLKDFVNWKLTHADKVAEAQGYPLAMENCKVNKKMKQLEVYGNSVQDGIPTPESPVEVQSVGELVTDEADVNYGKYKIPVKIIGENLFNKDKLTLTGYSYVVANSWKATENGVQFTLRGANTNGYISLNIGLAKKYKGKTLVFSSPDYYNVNTTLIAVKSADGKSTIHRENLWTKYENVYYSKITVPNVDYLDEIISIQLYCGSMEAGATITYSNIMVAIADTPQEYKPYVEPATTNIFLSEPLRKIGDYADYIDFKNKKVHRLAYEYCLDGSQNVAISPNSDESCIIWVKSPLYQYSKAKFCLCSHFVYFGYNSSGANFSCHNGQYININKFTLINNVTDADSLKQWFAENPTTFLAVLSTPIEEPIICELPKLKSKTTIIEVDTSLAPSNAYGKYIKK